MGTEFASGHDIITTHFRWVPTKVGIPNFVSGPREYIMEGEYVILATYVFMVPY